MKYRVDLFLACGKWVEYTSRKNLISLEMAESLAEHLRRNKTSYRIIEVNGKEERIVKEWLLELTT